MNWTALRDEFPILSRRTYLNSCSLGALSRRSLERIGEFHDEWHSHGAAAWYDIWMARLDELRTRMTTLIGARPGEVALAASTSAGLSVIASAHDYSRRSRVVVAELDFPTVAYQWLVRPGVELVCGTLRHCVRARLLAPQPRRRRRARLPDRRVPVARAAGRGARPRTER